MAVGTAASIRLIWRALPGRDFATSPRAGIPAIWPTTAPRCSVPSADWPRSWIAAATAGGKWWRSACKRPPLSGLNPWSVLIPDYVVHFPELPHEGKRNADGNYWIFPARDGWVRTVIGTPYQWNGFVEVLGNPDGLSGPEWADGVFRGRNRDVIHLIADEITSQRDRSELFEQGLAAGTTIGVIQSPSEFANHPQVMGRGFFRRDVGGLRGLADA